MYERDPLVEPVKPAPVREVMMGDIVETSDKTVSLSVEVVSTTPVERVEIRNGARTVDVHRPYTEDELGQRIRVVWSGADRRGRRAATSWEGQARFSEATISRFSKINAWNPERLFEQRGDAEIAWVTTTSGNFGGFDAWLNHSHKGSIDVETNHGNVTLALTDVGHEPHRESLGGLDRAISVFRLPDVSPHRELSFTTDVALHADRDDPLWVCVTTEDGFQAWSSPIYVI